MSDRELGVADNQRAVELAAGQLDRMHQPGWTIEYDRRRDTIYFRAPGRRKAITYFVPERPEIEIRMDGDELVGIDLVKATRYAKHSPAAASLLRGLIWRARFRRIPGFESVVQLLARGAQAKVEDQLQHLSHPGPSLG